MKKSLIALSIVAAISSAHAENIVDGKFNTVTGDQNIVTGAGNAVTGTDLAVEGDSNTAAGIHGTVAGKLNTVAGHENIVNGNQSVVVGPHAKGIANIVTAVGSDTYVGAYSGSAYGKGATVGDDGDAGTAIGAHALVTKGAGVAVGFHSNALGGQSTALGSGTKAIADQSTAVGNGAITNGRFSTALGQGATATNNHDVAIGSGSTTEAAVGTVNAEVNGTKFGNFQAHRPKATVSVGSKGGERTVTNVAAGRVTANSTDAVNGSQLYAVADKVAQNAKDIVSLNGGLAAVKDDVAINANKIAGNTEQIGNLNKVVEAQNAWNTAQDQQIADNKAANEATDSKHTTWNENQDKAIAGLKDGVNANAGNIAANTDRINNLTELVRGVSSSEARLKQEIHDARREARAGIAGANAIAAIPQPHAPGQTSIGAGAGYFKHEGAIALGVAHISKSGKWVSKAGVNFDTRKNVGAAVGVSYVFGGVPVVVPQPTVVKEVVREVIVREVQPAPATTKIRG